MRYRVRFIALAFASFVLSFLGSFFTSGTFPHRLMTTALCSLLSFQSNACLAQLPRTSERAVAAVSTPPAEKPSHNNDEQKVAGCPFGICVGVPKIPIPNIPGSGEVQNQLNQAVYQQIGDALDLKAPVHLDARHSFSAVSAPSNFKPQKLRLEDLPDLNARLPAGDYVMNVIAYCTKYSVHRPGRGVSYTLAPAEGSKIKAIAALAMRGEMAHVDRGLLQNVNMTIQTGLPLSQWRDEHRQVVHQLIPEFERDLRGDILDEYKAEYERVRKTIPAKLPGFDDILSHIPLGKQVLEIKKAREVLTDRSISAQEVGDRLYQATGPNDGLPQTFTPNQPQDSPWVAVRPGVIARFTVVNGRAGDGSSGINTLEFRITKEASGSGAKTKELKLAQAEPNIPIRNIPANDNIPKVPRGPARILDFPVRPTQIAVRAAAAEGLSIAEILFGTILAPEVLIVGGVLAVGGLIAYTYIHDTKSENANDTAQKKATQALTLAPEIEKEKEEEKCPHVVRGGIATAEQIQKGVAEHLSSPGLTGFSVQSAPEKTIEELAMAGQFKNAQISVTTVCALKSVGVPVVPSPGRGYHNTAVTPMPLSNEQAAVISAVFTTIPNPARVK